MKVHIALDLVESAYGGSHQFLRALRDQLIEGGWYAAEPGESSIILFSSFQEIPRIMELKMRYPHVPFVHRVDGPMRLYNRRDDYRDQVVQLVNAGVADGTVFQSSWSRDANLREGFKPSRYCATIGNFARSYFRSRPTSTTHELAQRRIRLIAVSWSANWKKGFHVYQWLDSHLDSRRYEMTFVGNSPVAFEHIRSIPPLADADLAKELIQHDIFITASEKDPCSNALIEALSCGLPALVLRDGGHPDLVGKGGLMFEKAEEIPALLIRMEKNYQSLVENIVVATARDVADRYLAFFCEIRRDVDSGRYQPKNLGRLGQGRLKAMLWWWKRGRRIYQRVCGGRTT